MKKSLNAILLSFLLNVFCSQNSYANDVNTQCLSISSVSFMLGEWQDIGSNTHITETWVQVSENTLEGFGETSFVNKPDKKHLETLTMVKMGDGIFYLAKVPHNPMPVAFKLMQCSDSVAVFENEKHDFPQKLHYEKINEYQLKVHVSSKENKGFELHFTRIKLAK